MKTVQLSGSARTNVGKKGTKAVRNSGQVPCVLYGQGEQVYFSVRRVDMEKLIFTPNVYQIEIDIEGTKRTAIIQDLQMHPVTDKPLHVDFLELADDKEVKINIPLRIKGRARGVVAGGILVTIFRSLKVKGLPKDLPAEIEVDVSPLRIGHAIRVGDLSFPGVTVLEDPNAVVVAVKTARGAVDDDDEEEDGEEGAAEGEEAASEE